MTWSNLDMSVKTTQPLEVTKENSSVLSFWKDMLGDEDHVLSIEGIEIYEIGVSGKTGFSCFEDYRPYPECFDTLQEAVNFCVECINTRWVESIEESVGKMIE